MFKHRLKTLVLLAGPLLMEGCHLIFLQSPKRSGFLFGIPQAPKQTNKQTKSPNKTRVTLRIKNQAIPPPGPAKSKVPPGLFQIAASDGSCALP